MSSTIFYLYVWFCVHFYYDSKEGIWRALGLGKRGDGVKFRENISRPWWASQLWDAEPFANSIDWLIYIECPWMWSMVGTLWYGTCWPLNRIVKAVARGRRVWETKKGREVLTIVMRASTDWYLCVLPDLLNAVHALFHLTFTAALEVGYSCGSYFEVTEV